MQTIGTCSHCGGPVQVPSAWGGSVPPVPKCARCDAEAANPFGVVIPMKPKADDIRISFNREGVVTR